MNILIDSGSPQLRNIGDAAMIEVAVRRVQALWPGAVVSVLTEAPELLAEICPTAKPLNVRGRERLCREGTKFAINEGRRRGRLRDRVRWMTGQLRQRWPRTAHQLMRLQLPNESEATEVDEFMEALCGADLLLAAGGGYLHDGLPLLIHDISETMMLARRMGIVTAAMGQGIGPVTQPEIRGMVAGMLEGAAIVGIREKRVGPELLRDMGVAAGHVRVTGDDALELAVGLEAESGKNGIGFNTRVIDVHNAEVGLNGGLAEVLHQAAARHAGKLIPLPMTYETFDDDTPSIRAVVGECPAFRTPKEIIQNVARCRVVVTGRYHLAVFAMAMGIPVVALAKSKYYLDKFMGLEDMFGGGCEMITLEEGSVVERVATAIDRAWDVGADSANKMREAAARQVEAGREAYSALRESVAARVRASA